ncbi:NERD domain-containing protein [Aerococcaceae bacterium DSM 111021]|nr:NERD domain-containing protein [Aerococcaceae bacterium DSM 111021]
MEKPIELVYMEILNERCVLVGSDKWVLVNGRNGYIGEVQLEKIALEVLPNGVILMMDLNFEKKYGDTQIDAVIVSKTGIHMFEVKNLSGQYEYRDGVWRNKGWKLKRDFFTQMKRAGEIFEGVVSEINIRAEIEPKLVLINEEDTVAIFDERVEGQYLKRWQVKEYIRQLDQDASWGTSWVPEEVVKRLKEQTTDRVVPKKRPVEVDVKGVYRGIVCCGCGGYEMDVESKRYHVSCRTCGYQESKEKAVLRTICDLAILDYDEPLRKTILDYYKNNQEIQNTIKLVFKKHFKLIKVGRSANYINPMKRMDDAFKGVKFKYRDYGD